MQQAEFALDVLVHGRPIREYPHQGQTYVEGRRGSEYILRVCNHSPARVLAVVTVDGLSIMDGSDGGYDGRGPVIEPHSNVRIPGWRLDNDEVAKFVFGSKPESYASQTGRPQNVGVIGCAIFKEVVAQQPTIIYRDRYPCWPYDHPWYPRPWRPHWPIWVDTTNGGDWVACRTATSNDSAESRSLSGDGVSCYALQNCSANASPQSIGTEFGQAQAHHVHEVGFGREASPAAIFEVWYDDRRGLEVRGIDLRGGLTVGRPMAFPRQGGCRPPNGWSP